MEKTIDVEAVLAPIQGENPSGEDLRYTRVYDDIKEARRADDAFALGEWQRETKSSDWETVISLSLEALGGKSKDLQIAVWLAEALVMKEGFGGLTVGLRIISGLTERFWDTVYPGIEDDDLEYRIAPYENLNEKLWSSVKQIPLTDPETTPGFSFLKWQESREVGSEADTKNRYGDVDDEKKKRRDELIADGKISAEEFDAAINRTSDTFLISLVEDLDCCRKEFDVLDTAVDEKFGTAAPRLSDLGQAIEECERIVSRMSRDRKGLNGNHEPSPADAAPVPEHGKGISASDQEPVPVSNASTVPEPPAPLSVPPAVLQMTCHSASGEDDLWNEAIGTTEKGGFKEALERLLLASNSQPSERGRNRYRFLVAKLCLKASRVDLARPIMEQLYALIVELQLERWESPLWIAEVMEALYQCLMGGEPSDEDKTRANEMFSRICTMDVTKALNYRN